MVVYYVINLHYKSPLGIFGAGYAGLLAFLVGISFFVDIGIGLGGKILAVVIVVLIVVYVVLSVEFLKGFGKNCKCGKQRFLEYEEKLNDEKDKKGDEDEENDDKMMEEQDEVTNVDDTV